MGEGWRLSGSSYSKKTIDVKCVLTVLHSWGPSRFQPICRGGGQPESPPSRARARGAERTAPCVCLDWELLRARRERAGKSSWQLPACSLARVPSHRETGSHTICHLAPPAVSVHGHNHGTGQNGFKKVGGSLATTQNKIKNSKM